MPIYEYQCDSCGQPTEILQKISDAPETICPHCHQPALKRLISTTQFQLKGTGWYVTDFRDKEKKPVAEKTTPTTDKAEKTEKKEQPKKDDTKPTEK